MCTVKKVPVRGDTDKGDIDENYYVITKQKCPSAWIMKYQFYD